MKVFFRLLSVVLLSGFCAVVSAESTPLKVLGRILNQNPSEAPLYQISTWPTLPEEIPVDTFTPYSITLKDKYTVVEYLYDKTANDSSRGCYFIFDYDASRKNAPLEIRTTVMPQGSKKVLCTTGSLEGEEYLLITVTS
ncbi:MAG: hypothetical protein AABY34_07320 [Pseudomonadota bacterium]